MEAQCASQKRGAQVEGLTAGAKVQALTALDFLLSPASVNQAWDYFNNVQTKDIKYEPLIAPTDSLRRSRRGAALVPCVDPIGSGSRDGLCC